MQLLQCCSAVAAVAAVRLLWLLGCSGCSCCCGCLAGAVAAWLAYGLLMHQRQIAFCEAVDVNTIQARFAIHTDAGRRLSGYGV